VGAVAGSIVVAVASVLPWARSGRAERSSYALVGAAERLGVLSGWERALAPLWYLVPALVAATWLAAVLGRRRLLAALSGAVGLLATSAAVATSRSPLEVLAPARVAGVAGGIALVGAIVVLTARGST
jgi:hypothetical protein